MAVESALIIINPMVPIGFLTTMVYRLSKNSKIIIQVSSKDAH